MEHCSNHEVRHRKGGAGTLCAHNTAQIWLGEGFRNTVSLGFRDLGDCPCWCHGGQQLHYTLDASQMSDFQGDSPGRRMLNSPGRESVKGTLKNLSSNDQLPASSKDVLL